MPVRPRRPRLTPAIDPMVAFLWACDDSFTSVFFGKPFATTAEAKRAWQRYRRDVWNEAHRFTVPRAAVVFDGLTLVAKERVWNCWDYTVFPLPDVLTALVADRAHLAAFEATPAARQIADYLELLHADLDIIERTARALAEQRVALPWQRAHPGHLSSAARYGAGTPTRVQDDEGDEDDDAS